MFSDLRFAFRQLFKSPGFTAVALLTLALGIGVNTTMFTVLNAFILHASASPDAERLAMVFRTSPQAQDWPHSPAEFDDIRKRATSFEALGAYYHNSFNLGHPGLPAERLSGMSVSGEFFPCSGLPPSSGGSSRPMTTRRGPARSSS